MDLNKKYAEHQKAVIRASAASDRALRDAHMNTAITIAGQIKAHQSHLGAAASCAWSVAQFGSAAYLAAIGPREEL